MGDSVKAHVHINYDTCNGIVSKLSYKTKGSFVITADLGQTRFELQSYDNDTSTKHKYKKTELYLLYLAMFHSHPLDKTDQQYINNTLAPIVNPLN